MCAGGVLPELCAIVYRCQVKFWAILQDPPPPKPDKNEDEPDILDRATKKVKKVHVLILAIVAVLTAIGTVFAAIRGWFGG